MANSYLDKNGLTYLWSKVKALTASNAMLFGRVDSTSTATVFTATVDGLTELVDGTAVYLTNHVVTSASGFTINVNGLGAKKVYNNLTNATRDTTIFNVAYSMLFIYDSTLDSNNGGWWCYRGYDSNTNTIGYQLRTNSANMPAVQKGYRYRLWLTDADGQGWVPINTSTSTDATTARALNTRPIDPFGSIVYCEHNATKNAGEGLGTSHQWEQYPLTIGYSYVKTLVKDAPVYLKCTPQADGSAVMADIVSALPTTNDGYIYIFLGTAYSTTAMELLPVHPVYWHDGTGIRLWTGSASSGATAMTDAEVNTAVDDAFVSSGNTVTISLTNPIHGSLFTRCVIYTYDGSETVEQVGSIDSPTGETTVVIPSSMYGLSVDCDGVSFSWGSIECSGGVELIGSDVLDNRVFRVVGDGAIIIDGNDYDD